MDKKFADSLFSEDALPLIVMGVPRSGTTFLQQVIDCHSQICLTDELRVFAWLFSEIKRLSAGYKVHGGLYPFNDGPAFANYLLKNAGTLIRPFYLQIGKTRGKAAIKYWGDKYPHYNDVLPELSQALPRARYVMIHRDLRDVTCSVMEGHKWDASAASKYVTNIYASYVNRLSALLDGGRIAPKNVFHVDYQKFSLDTEAQARALFTWLGLPFDDALAQRVRELREIQSHSNRPGSDGKPRKFDSQRSSIERWRTYLMPDQLEDVEKAISGIQPQMDVAAKWLSAQAKA